MYGTGQRARWAHCFADELEQLVKGGSAKVVCRRLRFARPGLRTRVSLAEVHVDSIELSAPPHIPRKSSGNGNPQNRRTLPERDGERPALVSRRTIYFRRLRARGAFCLFHESRPTLDCGLCSREAARRGIGTALFLAAEDAARSAELGNTLDASRGCSVLRALASRRLGLGQHQLSTGGWMPAVSCASGFVKKVDHEKTRSCGLSSVGNLGPRCLLPLTRGRDIASLPRFAVVFSIARTINARIEVSDCCARWRSLLCGDSRIKIVVRTAIALC